MTARKASFPVSVAWMSRLACACCGTVLWYRPGVETAAGRLAVHLAGSPGCEAAART